MNKNKNLISRRGLLQGAGATFVALEISAMTNGAFASSWPKKPITVVIMYGAGGGTDTVGRVLAKVMSSELGQQVNIINKPGAGGCVAAMQVSKMKQKC